MQLVAANVTGANRLLIGVGWSLVLLIFWIKRRRSMDVRGYLGLELAMLVAATVAMFVIFFVGRLHLAMGAVLIAAYLFYLWLSPNPPKDTDGRREGSGRGWVRELQGRWPGLLG